MEGTVEVKGLGRLDSGDLYDALVIKFGVHLNLLCTGDISFLGDF